MFTCNVIRVSYIYVMYGRYFILDEIGDIFFEDFLYVLKIFYMF